MSARVGAWSSATRTRTRSMAAHVYERTRAADGFQREPSSDLLGALAHGDQTVARDAETAVGAVAEAVAVVADPDGEGQARDLHPHVVRAAVVGRVADHLGDDPDDLRTDLVAHLR